MFTPAPSSPGFSWPLTASISTPGTSSSGRGRLRDLIHLRSHTHHNSTSRDPDNLFQPTTIPFSPPPSNANSSTSPPPTIPRGPVPHRSLPHLSAAGSSEQNSNEPTAAITSSDPPQPVSTGTGTTNSRRRTTKYSESAAEALLHSRSGSDPNTSLEPPLAPGMTRTRSATTGDVASEPLPSIRFSTYYDTRSNRPSLSFTPVTRTLPSGKEVIKVGRYSERENHTPVPINAPSAAPVGFKSKVVSRRHCEFWHEKGRWYIKDVKSSSGTFLNHIRLSAPGTESKPYPINDGDLVQLGIDFKGGEEMIYRCVKMRVELNRGWQAKPNTFNMATHKRLRDLTSGGDSAGNAQDCAICLNAIAPCQSLFVAPCSHTWHYKCIREMLNGPTWPIFVCPNCRATADLDAEVDEPADEWQQLDSGVEDAVEDRSPNEESSGAVEPADSAGQPDGGEDIVMSPIQGDVGDATVNFESTSMAPPQPPLGHATTEPVPIPNATPRTSSGERRTPSPNGQPQEGPITPRNDAGPWVFDGNPARVSQESTRRNAMGSLDAAAQGSANEI